MVDDVVAAFNQRELHDSKLRGLRVTHDVEGAEVVLVIDRLNADSGAYSRAELRFTDCRLVRAHLDLVGIEICGGDMAAAYGRAASSLLEELAEPQVGFLGLGAEDKLGARCAHFRIELIPPGGSIDIVARSFHWIESRSGP